jgi:hypothetical protein
MDQGVERMARKAYRVSAVYKLGRSQGSLDFVDVDLTTDTAVFLSPRALQLLPSEWGDECVHLIQTFFHHVLTLIREGKHAQAEELLGELREPNETRLGLSADKPQGHALGEESAKEVWAALSRSQAAKSGLLRDLEDTALMIEGIGVDIISDITTNIIRRPLIEYTQRMCRRYGIPMETGIFSGPMWNPTSKRWETDFVELPNPPTGKLLLVPKAIVRAQLQYKFDRYYRHYLMTHLQRLEFEANSALVRVLKDGTRKPPSKKSIMDKYGTGKKTVVKETLKHPEVLEKFRADMDKESYTPLSAEALAEIEGVAPPDWDKLLGDVVAIPTGAADAKRYEDAVEALLSALFAPDLTNPVLQYPIHDSKKIVDIKYTNMSQTGFFYWVGQHYPAPLIWVECKNYGGEVANPELDQLSGRFSPSRGKVGLLVCRRFDDKARFLARCVDTAKDDRGFIIPLDDDDLAALVEARKSDAYYQLWPLLRDRFVKLIS